MVNKDIDVKTANITLRYFIKAPKKSDRVLQKQKEEEADIFEKGLKCDCYE